MLIDISGDIDVYEVFALKNSFEHKTCTLGGMLSGEQDGFHVNVYSSWKPIPITAR
ncbi:15181_t:CDS:2 [Entrophospora sp. SA101]|nr:15181_t:CDS:2 [Entrophospora sp. SA101]